MLLPRRLRPDERVAVVTAEGFNAALRDPAVRAIAVAGTHRMLDELDVAAARADPKPVLGTGGTTFVHLELWRTCGLVGVHGDAADLTDARPVMVRPDGDGVRVPGRASGFLMGGSLAVLRAMVGAGLPTLDGSILLVTGERTQGLGQVDRQLTHLLRAGVLDGVRAVAVGRFTGFDGFVDREWTLRDVLEDRLGALGLPVLGGLPVGPGGTAVPVGTEAELDADAGTLAVAAAVR
ncbi:MAG TPA: LD-carboxypeptidase [Actinoplanes sp.]|jgi:muramoyltetrapeptide carboxypeptidase|nr:LD-carboxypeptidase [Actinoplanes sp.]